MRLGYFSPVGPLRSGVAQYSEDLIPFLTHHAAIDLYVDGYWPSSRSLTSKCRVLDYRGLDLGRNLPDRAIPFYHMGNSTHHAYIYESLGRLPGVTVLHDVVLHHFVVEMTIARGNPAGYVHEMMYCHGPAGADAARAVLMRLQGFPFLEYPLHRRVLDSSLRVVVHSEYARSFLAQSHTSTAIDVVPLFAVPTPTAPRRVHARATFGLHPDDIVFGSIGLVTWAKRLQIALPAFRRVHARLPNARFLIVGDVAPDAGLVDIVSRLGLHDCVQIAGFVEPEQLDDYIAAIDVGVCLRWPTMGESSASALTFLGAAVPTIVSNVGSFAELPDDCCRKIPIEDNEEDQLFEQMLALATNPDLRKELGARALGYVETRHAPESVSAAYIAAILRALQ